MIDLSEFLKKMLTAPGLSGYESPIREILQEAWAPLTDGLSVSKIGSLHGLKRGQGDTPRRKVMISAHMDAIGMMVTHIQESFIRITEIGGIDHRILPGQPVIVHGREELPGVVVQPPGHLLPESVGDGPVEMKYLLVDVGLGPDELAKKVRVGDIVSYAQMPLELTGEALAGHTLDNRVSVAATTLCLEALQNRVHDWDVWAVASAQEEETLGGAFTSPFDIQPDIAIVIDVCFAKGPGASDWQSLPFGEGVGLGYGPNIHPALYDAFEKKAKELEIPYHRDLMPKMSGTDAMAVQIVAEGIPCAVIGIPLRYMHTPVETVSLKDIRRAGRLMAEFIADLKPDALDHINWEE
ncbi:MAG: M20/M25/M40 family metallo-hydrolase [Brevefilum sp.]|nr:M20/M25/M40 family metallo-hydrolase [Brevefilum sp.]MDW7754620.1 M20/M25/M40 family metallo-hydrolase [Brevefilum sp.]